jgi:hypothetical protein
MSKHWADLLVGAISERGERQSNISHFSILAVSAKARARARAFWDAPALTATSIYD